MSLFRKITQRLSNPKVMLAFGVFDMVLGGFYLAQPKVPRSQGVFLMIAGALLVLVSFVTKRGEGRRARKLAERAEARKAASVARRRPTKAPTKAKGPKAGPGSRLAGPSRERKPVVVEPEPRRILRKKASGS